MAIALNIIFGYTGYLPFGFVAFYGIGAYTASILWSRLGIPILLSIMLAGLVGVFIALLFAPMLKLKGIYFAIVNFSFAKVLQIVIANSPEELTGGSFGIMLAAIYNPQFSYYAMLLITLLAIITLWLLSKSRLGIALRCIKEDAEAASVMGINIVRCRLQAWLLAAVFSSLVGAIEAWYTAVIDPETSFALWVTARSIIYAMFGGLGTVLGPIIGTTTLYILDEVIWTHFPLWNQLLLGLLMGLLILFLPDGVIGAIHKRYPELRSIIK